MSNMELLTRIILSFFTLLFLTRLMGRQEISQLTFFNFVSGIAIGSIGGNLAINPDISLRNGMIGLAGWCAITIVLEILDIKFPKVRLALEGEPKILIKNGKIMEKELKRVRVDVDALISLLRDKDIFSLADVDYAIYETNGQLSVLKKDSASKPTIQPAQTVVPIFTTVISDGKIIVENLQKLNLSQQWLEQKLMLSEAKSLSSIFYAGVQKDGTLYVDYRDDNGDSPSPTFAR